MIKAKGLGRENGNLRRGEQPHLRGGKTPAVDSAEVAGWLLLEQHRVPREMLPHQHKRKSRFAGEEAFEPCVELADAFAGKPAPTAGAIAASFL
ncbi:hypothetical protein [Pseudomonas sp. PH1b]|uniref:hypothetical protein n=1 Tax=Pseudomonas sp. PH1b TaxID=1397282 RepID=UPI00046A1859|nr:hypothetical protein [Pseudomonas sp. PH1b]